MLTDPLLEERTRECIERVREMANEKYRESGYMDARADAFEAHDKRGIPGLLAWMRHGPLWEGRVEDDAA